MPLYTVLAPPTPSDSVDADPVAYVFVKDGFCWPCLFVAELWQLFRRLWLVLLLYLAVVVIITAAGRFIGGPLPWLVLIFFHFYFALEANGLRRWTLLRHGYRVIGVAEGRRIADAEVRFFYELTYPRFDFRQPPPGRLQSAMGETGAPSAESGEVVGFFPVPGGKP